MYEVHYTINEVGHLKIGKLTWIMPNFINLVKTTTEIKTGTYRKYHNDLIECMIKVLGRNNDLIEIYYSLKKAEYLTLILKVHCENDKVKVLLNKKYGSIKAQQWQYITTFYKRDILKEQTLYLREDCLTLYFQFYIPIDLQNKTSQTQLGDDLENMLTKSLYSDVIMKSAEGKEYKVHKGVLACRSDVLKAYFEHNTIESQTNIVESPLEAKFLIELLTFIYSNKVPRLDEIPELLLAAADYYQLNELKSLCEETLHKQLTVENAIETLQLADLHSAETLIQSTLKFIKCGQAKSIIKTEGWAKLKSEKLIKKNCEYLYDN